MRKVEAKSIFGKSLSFGNDMNEADVKFMQKIKEY
jgi:hypothetical protein